MQIAQISTGFIEIKNAVSLNIFTQECTLKCAGCHNPKLQNPNDGINLSPKEIFAIINEQSLFDCICWMGGEPLNQYKELVECNQLLLSLDVPIIIYSGFMLDDFIYENVIARRVLLDGIAKLLKCGKWNGYPIGDSRSNQRFFGLNIENKIISIPVENVSEYLGIGECHAC